MKLLAKPWAKLKAKACLKPLIAPIVSLTEQLTVSSPFEPSLNQLNWLTRLTELVQGRFYFLGHSISFQTWIGPFKSFCASNFVTNNYRAPIGREFYQKFFEMGEFSRKFFVYTWLGHHFHYPSYLKYNKIIVRLAHWIKSNDYYY